MKKKIFIRKNQKYCEKSMGRIHYKHLPTKDVIYSSPSMGGKKTSDQSWENGVVDYG